MHLKLISTTTLALLVAATTSAATPTLLKPRNWDLRLFSASTPICDPSESNIDLSVFHNYGFYGRNCTDISYAFEDQHVESLSWKSPGEDMVYEMCMFADAECSGTETDRIKSDWEICYPYDGWKAYTVVPRGWVGCHGGAGN